MGHKATFPDSCATGDYMQSYQNKILPISLKNPLSLSQYQEILLHNYDSYL